MSTTTTFSQVLAKIGTEAPVAGLAFKTAVRGLLEALAEEPKAVSSESFDGSDTGWDFIVTSPVDGLPTPIYVIVNFKSLFSIRTIKNVASIPLPENKGTRLLVVHGTPARGALEFIEDLQKSENLQFRVWDYERLEKMLNSDASLGLAMLAKLNRSPSQIVQDLTDGSQDWRTRRGEHIRDLNNAWVENQLTIFIGAGLSTGAGLKNWTELLNVIAGDAIGEATGLSGTVLRFLVDRFASTFQGGPLILARYLRTVLADRKLNEEIRKALYDDASLASSKTSLAYDSVARICAPRRSGFGVRAIVNYNYDDLMDKYLGEAKISRCVISDRLQNHTPDQLPVYHVHGFLPRDAAAEQESTDPSGLSTSVVLSEEKYHSLYHDPYNWSNWVQLSALSSTTCLIVGHSLTDPNFRRLLEISSERLVPNKDRTTERQVGHYAILMRMNAQKFLKPQCQEEGCPSRRRDDASVLVDNVKHFLDKHHQTEEVIYRELGVNVIWVEDWSELPGIIDKIGMTRHTTSA